MTPRALPLFLALVTSFAAGCEPTLFGSDALVTETPAFGEFDRLDLSHEVRATVVRGSERRVELTINENLRHHLIARLSSDRLELGMVDGFNYQGLVAEVRVTVPALEAVSQSGATRADLTGFDQVSVARFDLRLSGASELSGQVAADHLAVDLSGASRADLGGSARELSLEVSGASRAGLDGLSAQVASVALSGASRADLLVLGEVRGEASGVSDLTVRGGALMNVETSGASSVRRR